MNNQCVLVVLLFLTFSLSIRVVLPVPDRSKCGLFIRKPQATVVIPAESNETVVCEHENMMIRWFKGSTAISISGQLEEECNCISIGLTPNNRMLKFMSFRPSYAGTYSCALAFQGSRFERCEFEVVILTKPSVSIATNSMVIQSGDTLTINPTVSLGVPTANITWQHNNNLLDPATDSRITIDPVMGRLSVTNVQGSDRGVYTIKLQNDVVVSATISVIINFLDEINVRVVRKDDEIEVMCDVLGNPNVMIEWDRSINVVNKASLMGNATKVSSTLTLSVSQCLMISELNCMAKNDEGNSASKLINELPCYNAPSVVSMNSTSVRVSWNNMESSASTYRVRYTDVVLNTVLYTDVLHFPTVSIQGLQAERTYLFDVATLRDNVFLYTRPPERFTTAACPDAVPSLFLEVTGVNAILDNVNGLRTVRVFWTPSYESGVTGYRVSMTPRKDLMSSDVLVPPSLPSSVLIKGRTSYTLDPAICDNVMYSYTVEAVNVCNRGSQPVTVSQKCSNLPFNKILFLVKKRTSNGFMFMVTVQENTSTANMVTIKTSTLTPQDNNMKVSNIYTGHFLKSGLVCITDLSKDTYYNICLVTDLVGDSPDQEICIQDTTSTFDGDMKLTGCLAQLSTTSVPIMDVTKVSFPDWAIALVVVGVLALVAFIFCCIGICFACSPDHKSEDYVYGSASSLQASSVGVPQLHRSASPPGRSSCLGRGHSTNWNEHTDAVRQMETDKGTHV